MLNFIKILFTFLLESVNTKSSINLVFDYIEHDIFGLL